MTTRILEKHRYLLAALIALQGVVLCWGITRPWSLENGGYNGALFSLAARNDLTHGFAKTRFATVINGDSVPPERFDRYTHHPPLLPVTLALAFDLFGEHEWAARLTSVLAAMASLMIIYLLGVELRGPVTGLLAVLFGGTPLLLFYGRMVNPESISGLFSLVGALFFLRWERSRRSGYLAACFGALAVGAGFAWPDYYLLGILPVIHLITNKPSQRDWRVLLLPAGAIGLFGIQVLHIAWTTGRSGVGGLVDSFFHRVGSATHDSRSAFGARPSLVGPSGHDSELESFSLAAWLVRLTGRSFWLLTPVVLLFAVAGLVAAFRRPRSERIALLAIPLALLLQGLIHLVLFMQGSWIHPYWSYYCGAPVALLAALGMGAGWQTRRVRPVLALLVVVFVLLSGRELRTLHRVAASDRLARLGLLLGQATPPGGLLASNMGDLGPQIRYYSHRDAESYRIATVARLEKLVQARQPWPVSFILSPRSPGAPELRAWLAPRAPPRRIGWDGEDLEIFELK